MKTCRRSTPLNDKNILVFAMNLSFKGNITGFRNILRLVETANQDICHSNLLSVKHYIDMIVSEGANLWLTICNIRNC